MDNESPDSTSQLVLDNRKLIIGFAILIVVCGSFFVIGFREGKRQGLQRIAEQKPAGPTDLSASPLDLGAERKPEARPEVKPDKAVGDQVDWYQNVNRKGREPVQGLKPPARSETTPAVSKSDTVQATAVSPPAKPHAAGAPKSIQEQSKITYSVQVGAFRYRQEAEAKTEQLKEKRYQYVIEQFGEPDSLYLVKVGKYDSRADAVAMQLRLRKDGFPGFVKTSK